MSEQIKKLNKRAASLKTLREPYEDLFRELGDNFAPTRNRFSKSKDHKSVRNSRLVSSKPIYSLRQLKSGMHQGVTSPTRPWFKFSPTEKELQEVPALKQHFEDAQREIHSLLRRSGVYPMLHTLWGDLGLYGTDCGILEDSDSKGFNAQALVPGEYWLGANSEGLIDTLYRETRFTIHQIVSKFVYNGVRYANPDWSNIPERVKNLWDTGQEGDLLDVCHVIAPRTNRDVSSPLPEDMPIASTYWFKDETMEEAQELGYTHNPIIASRWDATGNDVYGTSPCMDALADAKDLQLQSRDLSEARRRMNRPPMNVPIEFRNRHFSLEPEAANYVSDPSRGAVPAYQFNPPIADLTNGVKDAEYRVDDGTYANIFMMLSNLDRAQITAREVDERHDEKLLSLGPVLERQHLEKLQTLLDRAYNRVMDLGLVAPLPPEYAQVKTGIEYTSTLAQALKAVQTGGIERLYSFGGNLAAIKPDVMDKLDTDQAVDEYAEMVGVPLSVVRSDADVEEIRKQRQEMQQAAAATEQATKVAGAAHQGAQAAKVLSEAGGTGRTEPGDILQKLGLR